MKKIINDTIDLDDLNGARISTWISKLLDLQFQTGTSAIILAYAHGDTPHDIGCTIKTNFERLETDKEYNNRLDREGYLKKLTNEIELKKQLSEKQAEVEKLQFIIKQWYQS
jgi:hypothetical protein